MIVPQNHSCGDFYYSTGSPFDGHIVNHQSQINNNNTSHQWFPSHKMSPNDYGHDYGRHFGSSSNSFFSSPWTSFSHNSTSVSSSSFPFFFPDSQNLFSSNTTNTSNNHTSLSSNNNNNTSGRKSKKCKCPNCVLPSFGDHGNGKSFLKGKNSSSSSTISFSSNSPSSNKKHKCHFDGCDKVYGKTSHLKAHIRWHIGDRPFSCEWPHCGKNFTRSDELARHGRTHTGEKRFSCSLCGKGFTRSDHLSKHRKTHEKGRVLSKKSSGIYKENSGPKYSSYESSDYQGFSNNTEN